MKSLILLLWTVLCVSPVYSQPVVHTVHWGSGIGKRVVNDWVGSLDKVSNVDSTTYIEKKSGGKDKLHRAGHRALIVWIPGSTDLKKDFTTVIWFHGHWGYVPKRTFENRTLKQFVPLVKLRNFVVVIPEMPWSIHTTTPRKRNSQLWTKPGDFMKFISQVEGVLLNHQKYRADNVAETEKRLGKIDYRIIGHSAGGSAIKRIGITGDLCILSPSMVVWSDSSYGRWLDDTWAGCLKDHPDIIVKIFVQKWGSPWHNATRFLNQLKKHPSNIKLHVKGKGWSHKLIGDNVVRLCDLFDNQ